MTTIVIAGDTIASDSQMTVGGCTPHYGVKKIYDLGDCFVGIAGCASQANAVISWLTGGRVPEDKPNFANYTEESCYQLIGIDKESGEAFAFSGADVHYLPLPKPYAIGTGGDLALTSLNTMKALKVPLDVRLAVKMAISGDVYSGGPIKTFTVDRKKAKTDRLKYEAKLKKAEAKAKKAAKGSEEGMISLEDLEIIFEAAEGED